MAQSKTAGKARRLTPELIETLPAKDLILSRPEWKKMVQLGLRRGGIDQDAMGKMLEKSPLDDVDEAALYDTLSALELPFEDSDLEGSDGEDDLVDMMVDTDKESWDMDPEKQYYRDVGRLKVLTHEESIPLWEAVDAGKAARARLAEEADALSEDERKALKRAVRRGDEARSKLIEGNLRLVVKVVKKYAVGCQHLSLLDLIQEGNEGLMKAIDRFDVSRGNRLSSLACWWIRKYAQRAIETKERLIRLPTHMEEKNSRVEKEYNRIAKQENREPTEMELAYAISGGQERYEKKSEKAKQSCIRSVREVLKARQQSAVSSLDATINSSHDDNKTLADTIADPGETPDVRIEMEDLRRQLSRCMRALPDREQKVIRLRFGFEDGKAWGYREIGEEMGFTKERARQICNSAIQTIRSSRLVKGFDCYTAIDVYDMYKPTKAERDASLIQEDDDADDYEWFENYRSGQENDDLPSFAV